MNGIENDNVSPWPLKSLNRPFVGLNVVVLEGRNRVGGRTFSVNVGAGIFDLGMCGPLRWFCVQCSPPYLQVEHGLIKQRRRR